MSSGGSSNTSEIDLLPNDFAFAASNSLMQHQPGPDGDTTSSSCNIISNKNDLNKFQSNYKSLMELIVNYSNNSDSDWNQLKNDIIVEQIDVNYLMKFDSISSNNNALLLLNDARNKYNAELEILREDFDNRIDLMNVENEQKLTRLETKYKQEIDLLNQQLLDQIEEGNANNMLQLRNHNSSVQEEVSNFSTFRNCRDIIIVFYLFIYLISD